MFFTHFESDYLTSFNILYIGIKKKFFNILPFDDVTRFDQIWKLKSFFKIFDFHQQFWIELKIGFSKMLCLIF